jgi:hypothetical protein
MKIFTLAHSGSRKTPRFFSQITRIQRFAIIATLYYQLIISTMNTISFSLSLLHLEDSSSDYGKNAEYSKEDPVTEEIKFWKFRELPVEVRLMIWKEVCFKPRIIDIWGKSIRSLWPFGDDTWFEADIFPYPPVRPFVHRSYSRIPSILHVSREARSAGLKHYSLEFGTSWSLWHSTSDTRNI